MKLSWTHYREWLGTNLVGSLPEDHQVACPLPINVESDTRTIKPGSWFLALRGENFDGHTFVAKARAAGAAGCFVKDDFSDNRGGDKNNVCVRVKDTLIAYQQIATGWRSLHPQVPVLALTGSVGKTTTKEMLAVICSEHGKTLYSPLNFNNEIGLAQLLCRIDASCQLVVAELGARHVHDIAVLTRMCKPNVAACLNIGQAHLSEFGSLEALVKTKLEIFTESPEKTICVFNADDERMVACVDRLGKQCISFGPSIDSDCRIVSTQWHDKGGMSINLSVLGIQTKIALTLAHEAYPINAASACAIAAAAGIPVETMERGLAKFRGVEHRYQMLTKDSLTVIDDSYNANPASMATGLKTLARSFINQRKILVLGDMLELGDAADNAHRELGALCWDVTKPNLLITVGPKAQLIGEAAVSRGLAPERVRWFSDVNALIAEEIDYPRFGDVLYTKGSKGIGLVRFVQALEAR